MMTDYIMRNTRRAPMRRSGQALIVAAAILAGAASPAFAETYAISGIYGPGENDPVAARRIAVSSFDGELGLEFSYMVERLLGDISINQQPYFDMIGQSDGVTSDAILSGMATATIDVREITEERSRCDKTDDNGKCVKRRSVEIICDQVLIRVSAGVRVSRTGDDVLVYSDLKQRDQEDTYCPDRSSAPPPPDEAIDASLRNLAFAFRSDLAPTELTQSVRLDESTKGLSKNDKKQLKYAIALTKTDPEESCNVMLALNERLPMHTAIAFNSGLCLESLGDRDAAMQLYAGALQLSPKSGSVAKAISRIEDHERTLRFLAEREIRFGR